MQQRVDELEGRIRRALKQALTETGSRIRLIERALVTLSPQATLERGYAIVTRPSDGKLLMRSDAVAKGDTIDVRLAQGGLKATVDSTRKQK
jgi:exodeoxyribonuclease VII large subunit